jgi:septum formation protein
MADEPAKSRGLSPVLHAEVKTIQLIPDDPLTRTRVVHMTVPIILASGSAIRAQLLRKAGVPFEVTIPRIDEDAIKASMVAEAAKPRDIADALAEMKARKVSDKTPGAMVLGCDQVLDFGGTLLSKPLSPEDALTQLTAMRGARHMLLSAAVIYQDGQPIWRHVGQVRLRMRDVSDAYLQAYVGRNWDSIRHAVGAYKLEEEGVRLFDSIDGDYFNVLGMPLLPLLNFLTLRGVIDG